MRARAAFVAATAAILVPAAAGAAVPVGPSGPITATLSSSKAGTKPVVLTLRMHFEMVCGQPGPGTAVVILPAAAMVPTSIDASAVLVNGKPTSSVDVSGHDVTIAMPTQKGISCASIGPGTLTLVLTRAAGVGNPGAAGTYMIRVHRRTLTFEAPVHITA
jgi:hypothetical protein